MCVNFHFFCKCFFVFALLKNHLARSCTKRKKRKDKKRKRALMLKRQIYEKQGSFPGLMDLYSPYTVACFLIHFNQNEKTKLTIWYQWIGYKFYKMLLSAYRGLLCLQSTLLKHAKQNHPRTCPEVSFLLGLRRRVQKWDLKTRIYLLILKIITVHGLTCKHLIKCSKGAC